MTIEITEFREVLNHLRYVCQLAEHMHPTKSHNTHREEALALWRGTLDAAWAVIEKYENRSSEAHTK